jgi:ribonuclease Z
MQLKYLVFLCLLFLYALCFFAETCRATQDTSSSDKREVQIDYALLKEDKLRIYFCGTGIPQLTRQTIRRPSCLAILTKNEFFVIDAGEGTSQTIAALGLPYMFIDKAFMTHWHSDHMAGLASLINNTWTRGRKTSFEVYGPYGVEDVMAGFNKAYGLDAMFRAINVKGKLDLSLAFGAPKLVKQSQTPLKVYSKGDVELSSFSVSHEPVFPAVGYVLKYKGCKIVVSGDTSIVSTLANAAKDADVLINEAFSQALNTKSKSLSEKKSSKARDVLETEHYHSKTYDLAQMAAASKVKRLFLTHLDPPIFPIQEDKSRFVANMDKYYKGPITVADDGDSLVIESNGKNCNVEYVPNTLLK